MKIKYMNIVIFIFIFLLLATKNLKNHFIKFFISNFSFWWNFVSIKILVIIILLKPSVGFFKGFIWHNFLMAFDKGVLSHFWMFHLDGCSMQSAKQILVWKCPNNDSSKNDLWNLKLSYVNKLLELCYVHWELQCLRLACSSLPIYNLLGPVNNGTDK